MSNANLESKIDELIDKIDRRFENIDRQFEGIKRRLDHMTESIQLTTTKADFALGALSNHSSPGFHQSAALGYSLRTDGHSFRETKADYSLERHFKR